MAGILHIHAGLPKTGSSALQRFMAENREALGEAGIYIPDTGQRQDGPHHVLLGRLGGVLGRGRRDHAEALIGEIRSAQADAGLISSEYTLPLLRAAWLGRSLRQMRKSGITLRFHLWLRPQADFLNSAYPELLRSTLTNRSFDQFLAERMKARSRHYGMLLDLFTRAAGVPPTVHPFSRSRRRSGIWRDFLTGLDLDPNSRKWVIPGTVNPSLGPIGTYTLQRVVKRIDRRGLIRGLSNRREMAERLRWATRRFPREAESFQGLDRETRMRIWEDTATENEEIARSYWGQSWDEVFAEDRADDPGLNRFRPRRASDGDTELADQMMTLAWRACRRAARAYAERSAARRFRDRLMDPLERLTDYSVRLGISYG